MQVLVFVLNNTDVLQKLLSGFVESGIRGATIIESTGMARILVKFEDDLIFGSLKRFLEENRKENATIFMVINDEQVQVARDVIKNVVGDLSKPNTGILFALPVSFVDGID